MSLLLYACSIYADEFIKNEYIRYVQKTFILN